MTGVIAHVPNEDPRFVPISMELLSCCLSEVAGRVRSALSAAYGFVEEEAEEEDDEREDGPGFRLLFREKDLEDEISAAAFLKAMGSGFPCAVRVLFRLLGGKGGFGALLKGQKGGKKTTNFDGMRDLTGRRLRHSKAVERIKDWMEKRKTEDELVAALTGEGPELPKPVPKEQALNPEYVRRLKRAAADKPALVSAGLRRLMAAAEAEDSGAGAASSSAASSSAAALLAPLPLGTAVDAAPPRMPGVRTGELKKRARVEDSAGAIDWLGALDALGALSSPEAEGEDAEQDGPGSSSSAAAAAASKDDKEEGGDDEEKKKEDLCASGWQE